MIWQASGPSVKTSGVDTTESDRVEDPDEESAAEVEKDPRSEVEREAALGYGACKKKYSGGRSWLRVSIGRNPDLEGVSTVIADGMGLSPTSSWVASSPLRLK